MELPARCGSIDGQNKVLDLLKSLYGQIDVPRYLYDNLSRGLNTRALKTSSVDPCLFIGEHIMVVVYVDDVIFFARNKLKI